ncbi:MAG: hypothetical protein ACETWT_15530 [Thermodesulfobacteriota bacterium]|jgi:hypothetical protein
MVYFLPHRAHKDYPWLRVKKGQEIYKVVADSLGDLLDWGRKFGLTRPHMSRSGIPHYDLWGSRLVLLKMQGVRGDHKRLYRKRVLGRGKG